MNSHAPHPIVRHTLMAGAVVFFVFGAFVIPTTAAYASKAPTAEALAGKLVKAQICTDIRPVDASGSAVDCFPSGSAESVRVYAFAKKPAMLKSLKATQKTVCASLPPMSGFTFTLDYVVGPTWYVMPVSAGVSVRDVAKVLAGKVKPDTCG